MSLERPLVVSRLLLSALGTRVFVHYGDRVPADCPVLLVSNHRSFVDAPLLMAAMNRSVRFACHHYMSQVPVMREFVDLLGCFPLAEQQQKRKSFFLQASHMLATRQVVGVFPEGAPSMIQVSAPHQMREFERGFAHLALRTPVEDLAVLPVAIAAMAETCTPAVPLKLLSLFDPSEPLFDQSGWHPMVVYQRVNVLIGKPQWISARDRQDYTGKGAKNLATDLTQYCQEEIQRLLKQGCA